MASQHYTPVQEQGMTATSTCLPINIPVSVVVGTRDRPDDLRNCLRCLVAQETPRTVEIIVVDSSSMIATTSPVLATIPALRA